MCVHYRNMITLFLSQKMLPLWIIWKARCDVFNNAHIHLRTMLIEFWMLFVHITRGRHDDLQGSIDVLWQFQVAFKKQWKGFHLFSDTTAGLRWNYTIPSFQCKACGYCSTCFTYDIICLIICWY